MTPRYKKSSPKVRRMPQETREVLGWLIASAVTFCHVLEVLGPFLSRS